MIFKRRYKVPLYPARLHVWIVDDLSNIEEEANLYFENADRISGSSGMCFLLNDDRQVCVAIEEEEFRADIIAHEAKHAVNKIFLAAGVVLDRYNDEPECYLLKWVVQKCLDSWNKFEKKTGRLKEA